VAYSLAGKRIWIAGQNGMVGSAIANRLANENCNILLCRRDEIDLRRQSDVELWVKKNRPDTIIIAAAKVGGINANKEYPAEFLYDNLMIEANIINIASKVGVQKLVMLGSSCIYPKFSPQPISEADILNGPLESSNQWYAIAKISGVMLCQAYRKQYGADFISLMPTNLYGPGDFFDEKASHVIPALLKRFHSAKTLGEESITVWGSGNPKREFLHVYDAADAIIHALKYYSDGMPLNIGSGEEITIAQLAKMIAKIIGYKGKILFDPSLPDGTPRKLLDSKRLCALGWSPQITLMDGLQKTCAWYQEALTTNNLRSK